jgi:hypothetical protein
VERTVVEGSIPYKGAVIFINSSLRDTFASRLGQWLLDSIASDSPKTFGHTAIAINDTLAIEAMPADPADIAAISTPLPHTAKIAEWSGSELRAGVRLVPIADLIIPTPWCRRFQLVAWLAEHGQSRANPSPRRIPRTGNFAIFGLIATAVASKPDVVAMA